MNKILSKSVKTRKQNGALDTSCRVGFEPASLRKEVRLDPSPFSNPMSCFLIANNQTN
jgi:hypothetical protein